MQGFGVGEFCLNGFKLFDGFFGGKRGHYPDPFGFSRFDGGDIVAILVNEALFNPLAIDFVFQIKDTGLMVCWALCA